MPLSVESLALFDALNPGVVTLPSSDDLGYPPTDQGFKDLSATQQPHVSSSFVKESSAAHQPPVSSSFVPSDFMVASEVIPTRVSFNPSGDFISWRGFQISSSSQEILDRLLTRFPQTLDRLTIRMAPVQTFFLDRLASLILEMHSLSFYSLRAEDLDRFSSELNDFSTVGFGMSPFRARLDLLSSTF